MSKIFWKSLVTGGAALGVALTLSMSNKAQAATTTNVDQLDNYSNEGKLNTQDQITSVNELKDVAPTDWAYEALRSLVERYGCIVGYPDRTFRGDKALSRWEFAAGLNACLNSMERIIQQGYATKADVEKLKKLMQEFQAELAALGAKVDNLEGRVSFLENHQFSTTTKLAGEVIFAIAGAGGSDNQVVMQDRVRLEFDTTFTGTDVLHTRLAAGNYQPFTSPFSYNNVENGRTGNFRVQSPALTPTWGLYGSGGTANQVSVDWLAYVHTFKLDKNSSIDLEVAGVNGAWYDIVNTGNPYFNNFDGGNGALDTFATMNPIYRIGGGQGAVLNYKFGYLDNLLHSAPGANALSIGYLANNGGNPAPGTSNSGGLFNGGYAGLAQLSTNIANKVDLSFVYVNGYAPAGQAAFGFGGNGGTVGTNLANGLFTSPTGSTLQANTSINSYAANASFSPVNHLSVSTFFNYTNLNFLNANGAATFGNINGGQVWSYGGGIAYTDLGKQGSVLGLYVGVQPYLASVDGHGVGNTGNPAYFGNGLSNGGPLEIQLFYKYPVSDNISITPGVIWINNPTQSVSATSQTIGVLRGTFTF